MTVTSLTSHRAVRDTGLAAAIARHPAGSSLDPAATFGAPEPQADVALEVICRQWDRLATALTAGPDVLDDDQAEELLQWICSTLVHPDGRIGLVLMLPQLRQAITDHDRLRDGETTPHEVGCESLGSALARACAEIEWLLCPLVHGWPSIDACTSCVRHRQTVRAWRRRGQCPDHDQRAL